MEVGWCGEDREGKDGSKHRYKDKCDQNKEKEVVCKEGETKGEERRTGKYKRQKRSKK